MAKNRNFEEKKRRNLLLALGGALAVVVIISVVGIIIRLVNSATVEILVAPTDATITIGGHNFSNGTVNMQPGTYEVSVTREGFESYSGTFEAISGETVNLDVCLDTTEETAGWYDDTTSADYQACQEVTDRKIITAEQEWLDSDPILRVLPYHNYDAGYDIDYSTDEDLNITVSITPLSCNQSRADWLYEEALQYLRNQGIETENYVIERRNGCE